MKKEESYEKMIRDEFDHMDIRMDSIRKKEICEDILAQGQEEETSRLDRILCRIYARPFRSACIFGAVQTAASLLLFQVKYIEFILGAL